MKAYGNSHIGRGYLATFLGSILVLISTPAFADMCDELKQSTVAELGILSAPVPAGKSFSVPIQMTISQEQANRWDTMHLYAHFQNKTEGSRQLQVIHSLHEEPPKSLSFTTQGNMIGDYSISLTVIAQSVDYSRRLCSFKIETSTSPIVVKNDPAVADILPPTLTDITFNKSQVKTGDPLEFRFTSSDKSGLCTMWKANNNSCSLGTHVRLESQQGDPAIEFHYPTPVYRISDGKYLAVIPLSLVSPVKAGPYKITVFMVKDIHGNVHSNLEEEAQMTVSIID